MSCIPDLSPPILRLANINIERSKHLGRVMSFLSAHGPDVACLQEVIADDLCDVRNCLGHAYQLFVPMARHPSENGLSQYGVAVFSRLPMLATEVLHYAGGGSGNDLLDVTSANSKLRTARYVVAIATIGVGQSPFTIGTTHFPWTPDGSADNDQRRACENLLQSLRERQLVLCGDFNAPRGGEIFARLASIWRDNVPRSYTTSIDPNLHRAGALQLMVDGVFSTDDYCVTKVVLHEGISDHCALSADISRAGPLARRGGYGRRRLADGV